VELVALLSHPSTRILTAAPEPQAAVAAVLGSLSPGEDEELTARYRHVQEVRTGYQHGCAELALEGELAVIGICPLAARPSTAHGRGPGDQGGINASMPHREGRGIKSRRLGPGCARR
jgi:hypothetical protein